MKISLLLFAALVLFTVMCGCANAPGKQLSAGTPIVPNEVSDFNILYGENCAGCHGAEGRGGAAIALGDPVYLAIADDTVTASRGDEWNSRDIHARLRAERRRNAHGKTD